LTYLTAKYFREKKKGFPGLKCFFEKDLLSLKLKSGSEKIFKQTLEFQFLMEKKVSFQLSLM